MFTPWTSKASRQVLTLEKRTSIASLWPPCASITSSLPAHLTGTLSTETDRKSAQAFAPASPDRLVCVSEVRNVIAESTYGRDCAASVFSGAAAAGCADSSAGLVASAFAGASLEVDCARATFAASRTLRANLPKNRIRKPSQKRLFYERQRYHPAIFERDVRRRGSEDRGEGAVPTRGSAKCGAPVALHGRARWIRRILSPGGLLAGIAHAMAGLGGAR